MALAPPLSSVPITHRQSPWAVLDTFEGDSSDHDAPIWVKWSKTTVIFQHRAASFAERFKNMATSGHNSIQVSTDIYYPL
jgi:hypothetical protein